VHCCAAAAVLFYSFAAAAADAAAAAQLLSMFLCVCLCVCVGGEGSKPCANRSKPDTLFHRPADFSGRETIDAQKLWFAIIESQTETGTPYMLYKDACNSKSNQQNLGTIKCSNLCTEIVEFSSPDEVAVCNLASIALNKFVDAETRTYDFVALHDYAKSVARNLNKIIDVNYYPVRH
jgi:hypothetical protein